MFIFPSCNRTSRVEPDTKLSSSIQIIKDSYDIGVVPKDTIIRGYFVIKNNGDCAIKYSNIVIDCDCTSLDINKGDSIIPRKIDTINFNFNTKGMSSDYTIDKCIRIITNTKPNLYRFYIIGKVR